MEIPVPEGDTIHKLAHALRPLLAGQALEELRLRDRGSLDTARGQAVDEVVALGKHLLVGFAGRWVLHVHLGMRGRWHRYRPGEAWQRPPGTATAVIATPADVLPVFQAAVAEVLRRGQLAVHPVLSRLGPDLLAPEPRFETILRRARARERGSVAALLLDQSVACGIGNVYQNEVLFLEGVHPSLEVEALPDEALYAVYRRARELMRSNLGGWRRTTTYRPRPGVRAPRRQPRLWVYGRAGRPCLRCGTPIASSLHGDQARTRYWCPSCQGRESASTQRAARSHGSVGVANGVRSS